MKIKKIITVLTITISTALLSACSVVPTYYSEKQMKEYAGEIFESPSYVSSEKKDGMRIFNFEDREGRPFALYTYKYNSGFFKPNDISFIYEKAFNDTYENDIFEYEEENIKNIIDSYGYDYDIVHYGEDNWENVKLYIILNDEERNNSEALSEKLVPMIIEIDDTLNYNYNINGIGAPSDYNYTSCYSQCIISGDDTDDDNIITRISFSTDDNSRLDSELLTNDFAEAVNRYKDRTAE